MDSSTLPAPATDPRPDLTDDGADAEYSPDRRRSVVLALVATAVVSGTLAAGVTAGIASGAQAGGPATAPSPPGSAVARPADPTDASTASSVSRSGGQLAMPPTAGSPTVGSPTANPAPNEPDPSSGRIGPWQRMGHLASTDREIARVAADPRGVLLIGDSLATRTRPALAKALGKRPFAWNHWNGRPTHGTVDVVAPLEQSGRLPGIVMVLSGSNDVFDPLRFETQVDRLMGIVGPTRHVIWSVPTVRRAKTGSADAHNSAIIGAALRRAAATHPNLTLVDWAGYLDTQSPARVRALMPDGVHPSPTGSVALARQLVAALR